MTGKTHRAGGMLCSIVGFSLLQKNGLLLQDVSIWSQWLVIYPFCMYGSIVSDLDHHWDACPNKDYPSWLINKALHITKPIKDNMEQTMPASARKDNLLYKFASIFSASHRSWQTHSDLTLFCMLYLLNAIMSGRFSNLGAVDVSILSLVLIGLCLGIIAHFILDIITPDGVWVVGLVLLEKFLRLFSPRINIPKKLHLVPHGEFFATGGKWEEFIQKVLKILTFVALAWFLLNALVPNWKTYLPYTISFN